MVSGNQGLPTSPEMQMRWLGELVGRSTLILLASTIGLTPARLTRRASGRSRAILVMLFPFGATIVAKMERSRPGARLDIMRWFPNLLGGLQVALHLHPEVSASGEVRPWRYGAALFDALTITIERIGDDGFQLIDAPLADEAVAIQGQLRGALIFGCDVLVWPELTAPALRRDKIVAALGHDPLADPQRVPLVLAGSWHETGSDGLVNRTHLFASRGAPLAEYDKRRLYEFDGRWELIVPGTELPVIVMEDRLIGIANAARISATIAMTTSMRSLASTSCLCRRWGLQPLIEAHARSAKRLQSQQGAVSFVVQQIAVETGSFAGTRKSRRLFTCFARCETGTRYGCARCGAELDVSRPRCATIGLASGPGCGHICRCEAFVK